MRNSNLKIAISIVIGVLLLLGIYLLFDLNIIGIRDDNKKPVEENPIVEPIQNETIDPIGEVNATEIESNETINQTVVEPPKEEPKKEEPEKNETKDEEVKAKPYFSEKKYTCYEGDDFSTEIKTDLIYGKDVPTIKTLTSSKTDIAIVEKHPTLTSNCNGCTMIKVSCKKEGKTTLKVTNSEKETASVEVTVNKRPAGTLTFNKTEYECLEGDKISASLNVRGGYYDDISSYQSSDKTTAAISVSTKQPECVGCLNIDILCINPGSTTLTATSKNGATTNAVVNVKKEVGTIIFDKSSYSCNEGDTLTATITASGAKNTAVQTFNSSNEMVAKIEKDSSTSNDKVVTKIICIKGGETYINATSTTGATAKVPVIVKRVDSYISFTPEKISCNAGKNKSVVIRYNPATIESYKILDASVATSKISSIQPGSVGQMALDISCLKAGTTTLNFKLTNGFEKNLTIEVK